MGEIFRRILLILFPFACINLGYTYAQHDIAYFTSHDRIRREDIGGKKNEPYPLHCLISGSMPLAVPMFRNCSSLRGGLRLLLAARRP
jgi:hypothetical protein